MPFMFMPAKEVNTDAEWQRSQAMPTAGTCVCGDGAVGEAPGAKGMVLG